MGVFDIVMEKPAEVSRRGECIWYSHWKTCWSQSSRWASSADVNRFFHDNVKHTPLQLTSEGFPMTILNISIASTDFSWFSHDYVKNTPLQLTSAGFSMTMPSTHLFNWLQQVFLWLCQAHTSSTDFSRLFHDYIKHTHPFDWPQHVFPWLYQTHSPLRLNSAGFFMKNPAEVRRCDGCVWYSHGKTCWSQSRRWVCLT
jgi:hypothetical protein